MDAQDLYRSPNAIARHYTRFRVEERILLSGHSHQAWPDCAMEAQQQSWLDAAEMVDDKWATAFARADDVRRGYASLMGDPDADVALGQSTLELLIRLFSGLPLKERPRIVSTEGEFHTLRRLLDSLGGEWLDVVKVPVDSVEDIAPRLIEAIDERTSAVLVSSVLFQNARIVPGLHEVAAASARCGAEMVIDAYHHLNVVPFSITGLEQAYVLGGGYKYCQLGEGNCALRIPKDCDLKPVLAGWYSEFDALTDKRTPGVVPWGKRGSRFAGATYDPASNYRASAVFSFFREQNLTPSLLREVSQHQIGVLASEFDGLDLDPSLIRRDNDVELALIGGFLVLWSPRAGELCEALKNENIKTDYRGDGLRVGPAPYLCDAQLRDAMQILGRVCKSL